MAYLQIPKEVELELDRIKTEPFDFMECVNCPTTFSHHILGITPYRYQHYVLRKFDTRKKLDNDRIIICKSRQIGLSICVAILAIWYAAFNKANGGKGSGIHKNTKVGIISKSDSQSKKLMREIQNMVWNSEHDFQKLVKKDRKTPLNKSEIYFEGGWIKCYPPTDSCRGESFDLMIIDEAAFVDGDVFKDAMEPTVSAVGGKVILSSTPNGQHGFYYETFDPYNVREKHEYERIWFYWQMCENEMQKRLIEKKLEFAQETGSTKSFDQEYNALFTADQQAFLENQDIEKNIDREASEELESDLPVSIAIDYGMTNAETCITVVAHQKNRLRLLFQFSQAGLDDNLLTDKSWDHSIQRLQERYPNIQHFVVDDCAQGYRTNQEMETMGLPVLRFDFRSDRAVGERNRGWYRFRAAMKKFQIKYPDIPKLIAQLKSLQEIRMEIHMRIKGPKNHLDDRADSLMMACFPFLMEEDGCFSSTIIDYEKTIKKIERQMFGDPSRYDKEWDDLKNKSNPYDFLMK